LIEIPYTPNNDLKFQIIVPRLASPEKEGYVEVKASQQPRDKCDSGLGRFFM
jgi:hypothetical protein